MKKPSIIQIFFAKTWLWNLSFWGFPVIIGILFLIPMSSGLEGFTDYIKAIFAAAMFGFFCSYFPLFILNQILMKINGSPYHEDDKVHILVGMHKGKTAHVYEIWKDRKQVRVDLGEQAKEDIDDIYSYIEVCRAT